MPMNRHNVLSGTAAVNEMESAGPGAAASIPDPIILTRSVEFETTLKMAEVVARHRTPVLIEGDSGTGKELLARFIHCRSSRAAGPFIAVNCAAIPETLLESELFGCERGAFTGAVATREGKFEMANGGTILLDEISELAWALQVKLLRVLQEYEIDRLGGRGSIPVNTRIIATTNQPLKKLVANNRFRGDLYYRINVFPLKLTHLRERIEDLNVLIPHFVCKYNGEVVKEVDEAVYRMLFDYSWHGNVRELENVIARAVLLAHSSPRILPEHIIFDGIEVTDDREATQSAEDKFHFPKGLTLREMEKLLILKTLEDYSGNRTHASRALAISVRTLRNKLNEYRRNGELTQALSPSG